ncbi:hypothetical protein YY58_23485, partial [Salmonella enterica subsp. enterica serovar Agona]|nr:hypothetical protein [Salmonella enterica subsp. enterica serovar Agona]
TNQQVATNTTNIANNTAEIAKGLNFGDGATSNNYALGDTINVTEADSNIETTTTSTGVSVGLADDISVESVTVGDSTNSTVLTSTANGLSVNNDKITNVVAGDINATSTDAVNGSQLYDTNQQVAGNTSALGGGASYDPATNTYTAPSYTVTTNPSTGASTTANNVGAALSGLNTAVNQPLTFAGDTGTNVTRQLGSILNVEGGASGTLTDNNIGVVANGTDTLTVKLAKDIDLGATGSVTTGNTVVNANGLTINNPADTTKTVSVTSGGINAGGNVISNVAAGSAATDAVNVSQLNASQAAATTEVVEGKNISVSSSIGADGQTIYTVATDDDVNFNQVTIGSTTGNNTILTSTADGLSVGGDKITNVAA